MYVQFVLRKDNRRKNNKTCLDCFNQHIHENKDTIRDFKPKSKEQELGDKEIFLVQKEKNQSQRKKEGNRKNKEELH